MVAVLRDGARRRRFLVAVPVEKVEAISSIRIVQNWFLEFAPGDER